MTLKVNNISGTSGVVRVAHPNAIYQPGQIIQVKWSRAMQRLRYNIPNNDGGSRGDVFATGISEGGTIIRPLDVTITPKSLDSTSTIKHTIVDGLVQVLVAMTITIHQHRVISACLG